MLFVCVPPPSVGLYWGRNYRGHTGGLLVGLDLLSLYSSWTSPSWWNVNGPAESSSSVRIDTDSVWCLSVTPTATEVLAVVNEIEREHSERVFLQILPLVTPPPPPPVILLHAPYLAARQTMIQCHLESAVLFIFHCFRRRDVGSRIKPAPNFIHLH